MTHEHWKSAPIFYEPCGKKINDDGACDTAEKAQRNKEGGKKEQQCKEDADTKLLAVAKKKKKKQPKRISKKNNGLSAVVLTAVPHNSC